MSFATQEEFQQLKSTVEELFSQVGLFGQEVEKMRNERADLKSQTFAIEERENLSDAKLNKATKAIQDLEEETSRAKLAEIRMDEVLQKIDDLDLDEKLKKMEATIESLKIDVPPGMELSGLANAVTELKSEVQELKAKLDPATEVPVPAAASSEFYIGSPQPGQKRDDKESAEPEKPDVEMGEDEVEDVYTTSELEDMTVVTLKVLCKERGLSTTGLKAVLVSRLAPVPVADPKLSKEELEQLKVPSLRKLCADAGVPVSGPKAELVSRLLTSQKWGTDLASAETGIDITPDSWKGASKGKGKGAEGKGYDGDRGEKSKNICERKLFDKRVGKFDGVKGEAGEKQFEKWLSDVRKVTKDDPPFHDFLQWLTDLQEEVTPTVMKDKEEAMMGLWPMQ